MLRIFVGIDTRQPIAFHVLCSSIQRLSSKPVAITPLLLDQLPIERRGQTDFTFSRFLVPYLCDYEGKAVFMDSDMLLRGDIAELFALGSDHAVSMVHFKDELAFERTSLMLFNCDLCKKLTPMVIEDEKKDPRHIEWADSVGSLPSEWNHLVGYTEPQDAKLVHFTQGIPAYKECRDCEYSDEWNHELRLTNWHTSWIEVMGGSKHMQPVIERLKNANQ